jgi:hypothetical protein
MTPSIVEWRRVMTLLAIDPGACTGWAAFRHGALYGAGVMAPEDDDVAAWGTVMRMDLVVIENPRIYPRQKANPNDILKLARCVGRYEERFGRSARARVQLVEPHDWKGSIPKEIMTNRIESELTFAEQAVLPELPKTKRHNMLDAVGLGKWAMRQAFYNLSRITG